MGRVAGSSSAAPRRGRPHTECLMDFGQFTERARGVIQAAQMTALAGRHQILLPEHLLKALIDDSEGLAARIVRDAGGNPDLLRRAADEQLGQVSTVDGDEPHPIYMSPALAAVLQGAVEGSRAAGDKFVTTERLLESLASHASLRTTFTRAGVDPKGLAAAIAHLRNGRTAD